MLICLCVSISFWIYISIHAHVRVHQQAFMLIYVYISIYSYVYVYICIYMQSYVLYVQVDNHVDTCGCCVIYWAGLRGACWLVTSTALGMSCMCRQSVHTSIYCMHIHTILKRALTQRKRYTYVHVLANKWTYKHTVHSQPEGAMQHDIYAHTCTRDVLYWM